MINYRFLIVLRNDKKLFDYALKTVCDFPGTQTSIPKEPYSVVIFQEMGSAPCPPSGSAHVLNDTHVCLYTVHSYALQRHSTCYQDTALCSVLAHTLCTYVVYILTCVFTLNTVMLCNVIARVIGALHYVQLFPTHYVLMWCIYSRVSLH